MLHTIIQVSFFLIWGASLFLSLYQIQPRIWWRLVTLHRRKRIRYEDRRPFNRYFRFLTVSQWQQVPHFWALTFLNLDILLQLFHVNVVGVRDVVFSISEFLFLYGFYTILQLFLHKPMSWKVAEYLYLLYLTFGFYVVNYQNFLSLYSETSIVFEMLSGIVLILVSSFYLLKLLAYVVKGNFAHTIQIIAEFSGNIYYHGVITGTALLGATAGQAGVNQFLTSLHTPYVLDQLTALAYYGLNDFFEDLVVPQSVFTHFNATILYIHMISLLFGACYTCIILANLISVDD
ncbi:hypothetical protein [Levilactobacillus bambusae]|uniref:Uncharacterized protein n=1 Tax=Levilactobacillus bambusae TaxID=2024736 RepID=A0A2V1MWA1_9LACO|nr:hypothetical protein [Levilactobacillus bambusae]PWF99380.1 hypothetical protein DCM90_07965 [Levilactobacillus bambusae]